MDNEYQEVIRCLRRMEHKDEARPKIAKHYAAVYEDLNIHELDNRNTVVIYRGTRLGIPQGARQTLLKILHLPHLGEDLTIKAANSRYYWPDMVSAI